MFNPLDLGDVTITSWKILAEHRHDWNLPEGEFWLKLGDGNDSPQMHNALEGD